MAAAEKKITPTGPVFHVEDIDDGATPDGLALAQYNVIASSTAFTGEQKELLSFLVACATGKRPAAEAPKKEAKPEAKKAEDSKTPPTGDKS